jgi:Tfp pilus assembly protein PilF
VHSLAIVNYARGLFVRAEELFLLAKRIDPQNADIPYNYGIFNYDAHRPQKSEKEWLLSVKLNPSYGNAYLNLSYLFYEQGKFEEAWTNCQSALKHGITVPISLIKEIEKKVSGRENIGKEKK